MLRHSLLSSVPVAALALAITAPVTSQVPPGGPVPVPPAFEAESDAAPASRPLQLGRKALAAGRPKDAVPHLLAALERAPGSAAVLAELARTFEAAGDRDARQLAALALASATVDTRGRSSLAREDRDALPKRAPWLNKLAKSRAAAVTDLQRFVSKLDVKTPGDALLARFAADLAREIGRDVPLAAAATGEDFERALAKFEPAHEVVFEALRKLLDAPAGTSANTESGGNEAGGADAARRRARETVVEAARILVGLGAQVKFGKDLQGPPPPDLGDLPGAAQQALDRARAEALADVGEPWTVERLEALSPEERRAFTADHASWAWPGVAVSARGGYLVETTCGFDTLLAAASTVDQHHARLAGWYGSDPFTNQQGVLRIEPEHGGLESRGAPFWWAGGFQAGNLTTIRVAWSGREGMGRTLTHELTHRFDGTLCPFQPSWLTEGKAVWTGRSYERISSTEFVARYLPVGATGSVFVDGYGGLRKLTQLIEGTIDDYRDNYSAGAALYTYLKTWRPSAGGEPLFAAQLETYIRNLRAGRKQPLDYFESHFADGQEGRPEGMKEFAAGFRDFVQQCYRWGWRERDASNAWVASGYQRQLDFERGSGLFGDRPTWSWARKRAEPWFGQGQAARAGRLLERSGKTDASIAAWCWSLQVDGWTVDAARALARLLAAAGQDDAAVAVQQLGAQRFPGAFPESPEDVPALRRLSKLRKLLSDYEAAASAWRESGLPVAAAWLDQVRADLSPWTGGRVDSASGANSADCLFPRRDLARPLASSGGWTEDGLTGYEERRRRGLWFETAPGADLHVGREKPRDDTGLEDRRSIQRHAYVRTASWIAPGRYVVRLRIHFTTAYVSGAVVLGTTRRDRNVRLGFSAGDLLYAIGRKDADAKKRAVRLSIEGLFEREGSLSGSRPRRRLEFDNPQSFVDLELHVDGPTLRVVSGGEEQLSYTTPTGAPIEGAVGFAMGQGAVRVQAPSIQRLDRRVLDDESLLSGARDFPDLVRERAAGFPTNPDGTMVIWVPNDDELGYVARESRRVFRRLALPMRDRGRYPQPWAVMVPPRMKEEDREAIRAAAAEVVPGGVTVVDHVAAAPADRDFWVLFVDGFGVLRAAGTPESALPPTVESWARFYRAPR